MFVNHLNAAQVGKQSVPPFSRGISSSSTRTVSTCRVVLCSLIAFDPQVLSSLHSVPLSRVHVLALSTLASSFPFLVCSLRDHLCRAVYRHVMFPHGRVHITTPSLDLLLENISLCDHVRTPWWLFFALFFVYIKSFILHYQQDIPS